MSLNAIMTSAYTGLNASQAALRTIANNIANVNTPGYARETVSFENIATGDGSGVKISGIQRAADLFLERASYSAQGDAGRFAKLDIYHSRFQGLLGKPDSESSLSARIDRVFGSLTSVATDPSDSVRRQAVLSDIDSVLAQVRDLGDNLQQLRADASNEIAAGVAHVNDLLQRIGRINPLIVREKLIGGNIGPMQEQRDSALRELSQLMDISTSENADGSLYVATGSGVSLVDGKLRQLEYYSPATATSSTNFPPIAIMLVDSKAPGGLVDTRQTLEGELRTGELRGLIDLRDSDLPELGDTLGEMARLFMDSVNEVHSLNSSVPPPRVLEGRNTGLLAGDRLGMTGQTTIAVVDRSGVLVRKATIDFSAMPATATVADLVATINGALGGDASASFSNGALTLQASSLSNGIALGEVDASASSRGGVGFSQFFGLNDLVQASRPSFVETGFAGGDAHGFDAGGTLNLELRDGHNRIVASHTLTVSAGGTFNDLLTDLNSPTALGNYVTFSLDANGAPAITPQPGQGQLDVRVISDSTNRGNTGLALAEVLLFGQGAKSAMTRDIALHPAYVRDPTRLALARLDTTGAVGDAVLGRGDQRGAEALRDLQQAALSFDAAGAVSASTVTLNQYAGFFLGDSAIKADRATTSASDAEALKTSVIKRRDDMTGVNMDEELSNMLVFQSSYGASARLMSTVRELYDVLISIMN